MFWIGLIFGFCTGGLCGLIAMALMNVVNEDDTDVPEEIHGHWIENEDDFWVMCSECGTEFLDDQIGIVNTYKHCPYCGVKMGGDDE